MANPVLPVPAYCSIRVHPAGSPHGKVNTVARWSSFESKVAIAFGAAVLVVAALVAATWRVANDASQTALMLAHTHEVLNNLARTRGYTLQIELATQNFRLSGDPAHIAERDDTIAQRERTLERIQLLTASNPDQHQRWGQLREIVNQRMVISRQVEMLRKTQGQEAANAFVATAPLRATRARTYELLGDMDTAERHLLTLRANAHAQARQKLVVAGSIAAAMLVALLGATYLLIRRQLRETETSQRALADSEESLSTTLHSIGDAVLATDTEGRILRMNPVAEQLTGWPIALARGLPVEAVFRIVNEQTREPALVPVAAALATGEIQALANHTSLLARDGTECPIADSAAPIRDANGQLHGVVLVFRDVTAERQAEQTIRAQNILLESHVRERTTQLKESEDHLRSVIGAVPALIAFVSAERRYVYVNDQYRQSFAPERADITGCTVQEILGDERYGQAAPMIDGVLAGTPQAYDWQPFPGVWQAIRYLPRFEAHDKVGGYYVLGTDITDRKHFENRIQTLNTELEQRIRQLEHATRALRTLSAGNRTMLRASEEQDLLDSMCQAIVTAGGYGMAVVWYCGSRPELPLEPMAECGYPGGMDALRQLGLDLSGTALGQGVTSSAIRTEEVCLVRNMNTDPGHAPWHGRPHGPRSGISCPLRVAGRVIGALSIYDPEPDTFGEDEIALLTESSDDLAYGIATLRSRVEQERVQAAMHHFTRHDPLTGLPNALQFEEALAAAIHEGGEQPRSLAVLQFNIERLSEINEALGFAHGDDILREFARRLQRSAPPSALVARLRGDEFAALLPDSDLHAARHTVNMLEQNLSQPISVAGIALDVVAKAGIALFPEHGRTVHDLLRRMDKAVHQAKRMGVDHVVFIPQQEQDQAERLNMAGELRHAIDAGQLRVYLQPKVDFASGRVCGAEALVRWLHPQRGLLAPGVFIELAEHTGLIKPLTEWMLVSVLDILQAWQRQGCALPIAVNLSARNLRDEQLFAKFRHWQRERGVARGLLEVEITESTVMEDAQYAMGVLHALREEGIPLYIDDFGTGYSSLAYLQKLPVDCIKIDQSFVAAMTHDKSSAKIVRSTIDLVHDLDRKTVAEGIETREHWEQLLHLGCDIAQGYFIARPTPGTRPPAWAASFRAPAPPPGG